jgi:hypothetical protein
VYGAAAALIFLGGATAFALTAGRAEPSVVSEGTA